MFIYTRAYFKKLINDFKTAGYVFNVVTPLVYIVYLLYAIFTPVGYPWANIPLLAITVLYLVFYIATYDIKEKAVKETIKRVKHIYKGIKLTISAMTLGITFYGIYTATTHTTALSVVLTCLMAIFWLAQVSIELIIYFLEYQTRLLMAAIEADKDAILKPFTAVGNFVKRVVGKEPEEPKAPNKILGVLSKTVEKIRNKTKQKVAEETFEAEYEETEDNEPITK